MMFQKLLEGFKKSRLEHLYQSGKLHCPDCGAVAKSVPAGWEEVFLCHSCGVRAPLSEWLSLSTSDRKLWTSDAPPADTKIIRKSIHANEVVWEIPASGRFGFFFVFAVMWLFITAVVSGGFLIAFLKGEKMESNMPVWFLIPFFGIFWAVGLGMLYAGLREKYLK